MRLAPIILCLSASLETDLVTFRGSFQPLGFQSRDMGLFKDDDGSAYLLSEDVCISANIWSSCCRLHSVS